MKYFSVSILCVFLLISCAYQSKPVEGPTRPFESDGCSCWPDQDYFDCCYEHDKVYWTGGSPEERMKADQKLRECVAKKGHKITATLMYWGVRVGGHGWLPTSFRVGILAMNGLMVISKIAQNVRMNNRVYQSLIANPSLQRNAGGEAPRFPRPFGPSAAPELHR